MSTSPAARLRSAWDRLSPLPGGKKMFSLFFGGMVPYTGSIRATVQELAPGHAVLTMRDRRAVRNHLASVHAVALVNLAEATSGLAMTVGLPDHARAIVTSLTMDYLKKARGTLTATCNVTIPDVSEEHETLVTADIRDAAGDVVAKARVTWRVGPDPRKVAVKTETGAASGV